MNTEIDISNVTLHTDRMILRPWRQTDLDDLYAYASVDGVGQMAGWKPHESKEESQKILDMFIGHKKTFALEYQGKVIGSLGIEQYNEDHFPEFADRKCREIGYVLSKEYWGQGLMPEAVKEVIRYLFEEVGLDVIFCGHFLWNKQSQRVQEKCGFKHYAFDTYETKVDTTEEDEVNILTREDWQAESVVIRDYDAFDRNEIMNLYTSVGWTNYTDHPQMLEKAYMNSLCTLGAYTADNSLIGIIRAVGDGASILFIQDIIVLPEFQRRGIGTALLRAIISRYPDVYQTELMTDNTDKTIAFYKSLGFTPATEFGCLGFMKLNT